MNPAALEAIIREVIHAKHFAVRPPLRLTWEEIDDDVHWELYRGRALDATMTRNRVKFRAWNIQLLVDRRPAPEPLISVKWDLHCNVIHITRAVLCYAHEAVTSGNVVETKATTRWIRELVYSIHLDSLSTDDFRAELEIAIGCAVYGTGRLPLTSLEAPLPQFLLGQLAYIPSNSSHDVREFEFNLRNASLSVSAPDFGFPQNPIRFLRQLFRSVSLSPYTCLVSNVIRMLRNLRQTNAISPVEQIDYLSWLIRLQWRHLNAYDLFLFHHRGANYPDALLVEEVLHELLSLADQESVCFDGTGAKRIRR